MAGPLRRWFGHAREDVAVLACGWAWCAGRAVEGSRLAEAFAIRLASGEALDEILPALDGSFAIVCRQGDRIVAATDRVRSIPLLHCAEGAPRLSDSPGPLLASAAAPDAGALLQLAAAGYVTGAATAYPELRAVRAGERVQWTGDGPPQRRRWFDYRCRYDDDASLPSLIDRLDAALSESFSRLVSSLAGRPALVPLSDGWDSRLVAALLLRCGHQEISVYCYGRPGAAVLRKSAAVAHRLGIRWTSVPLASARWRATLGSARLDAFLRAAWGAVSLPQIEDWLALESLTSTGALPCDAVVIPGHTGDYLCGGHLNGLFQPAYRRDREWLAQAILSKHFALWGRLLDDPATGGALRGRIDEALAQVEPVSDEALAAAYEQWDWQERQAKYIVNGVRAYEAHGLSWRLPLWSEPLLAFWSGVPLALKLDEVLWRAYLRRVDPGGAFGDVAERPARQRLAADPPIYGRRTRWVRRLSGWALIGRAVRWGDQWARHAAGWWLDPTGLVRGMGGGQLLRDLDRRHVVALLGRRLFERCGLPLPPLLRPAPG